MLDLWWTKWDYDKCLSEYLGFARQYRSSSTQYSFINVLPTLHISAIDIVK